jgi:hypothetical protein
MINKKKLKQVNDNSAFSAIQLKRNNTNGTIFSQIQHYWKRLNHQ